jgi:hypothetical protein
MIKPHLSSHLWAHNKSSLQCPSGLEYIAPPMPAPRFNPHDTQSMPPHVSHTRFPLSSLFPPGHVAGCAVRSADDYFCSAG